MQLLVTLSAKPLDNIVCVIKMMCLCLGITADVACLGYQCSTANPLPKSCPRLSPLPELGIIGIAISGAIAIISRHTPCSHVLAMSSAAPPLSSLFTVVTELRSNMRLTVVSAPEGTGSNCLAKRLGEAVLHVKRLQKHLIGINYRWILGTGRSR